MSYYDPPEPKEIPEDAIREALENKAENELCEMPSWDGLSKKERKRMIEALSATYSADTDEIIEAATELLAYRREENDRRGDD